MAQWLRALAALPVDPGLIASTYMGDNNHVTPVPKDPLSSGLYKHYTHSERTHADKTHT